MYLLRDHAQIEHFRRKYAAFIRSQGPGFVRWICSWYPAVWTDYLAGVPEKNVPAVVGIICILYIDGLINIDFNSTATLCRRNYTDEEMDRLFRRYNGNRRKT